ncbi:hypothetical protein [Nodularia sphaerocarpa]|uniref:hypothetical protein n=1 Tax=Nodularia sphaerocarpa TaxID=137816 RepID=UPI001EFAAFC8|nr:hypothetical protein [Nodularia sphaerocarpa]MDB9372391.1 hypothetical protein [Nodularia sphaerocarpa CS-585]ULP71470.1 hypothetical protein BDGGKGIB_01096 [Nodularia sphaerocarpa UHCC 0038]ULP73402.1 hypothetical protein BDGGKGIB_03055 [Nodularia sphaerocarpa UHCC 0038]
MPEKPKVNYVDSAVYKHRYKSGRRPEPQRCPVIKRDGTQCKNKVMLGYKCCASHGGKAAKARITHGLHSKLVKQENMKAIKSLSAKERKELLATDYSKESLLDNSIMLTDAMLCRLIEHQSELIERYDAAVQLSASATGSSSREVEVMTNNINGLSKAITDISKVIQIHQAQINATLKTKKELRDKNENEVTLQALYTQLSVDPKELIQDLVKAYLTSNPEARVDDLLALKPADVEIQYELEGDD